MTDLPSALLVHSTGTGGKQWLRLMAALRPRPTAAPDHLGYAPDRPAEGDPTGWLQADIDIVERALLSLPAPVDVVAHSYGGFVALTVVREHAHRVRRLVLCEPVLWGTLPDAVDPEGVAEFDRLRRFLFEPERAADPDAWLRSFVDFWNGPGSWDALPDKRREQFIAVQPKMAAEVYALCYDPHRLAHWTLPDLPVLVLHGSESPPLEIAVCKALARELPDARITELEGLGHMGPVTRPRVVNAEILRFLNE